MKTRPAARPKARTFRNPVIPGFHPDPSICRVGDDFYLVTSSFEYFPGVPIFHSLDLVHWRQVGHVLTRPSQLGLRGMRSSGGIYAPTLRHRRGRFYMVTTNVGGGGHFYVTAKRPEGPWSDPIWLDDDGIDPSFLFDGDAVYYTRDGKGPDFDHPLIYQAPIDVDTGKIVGKPKPIWGGTWGIWTEGAHLYKIGTTYYLMAAEGGTAYDHSEVIARSSTPFGPFEAYPGNPIVSHRYRRRDPIQAIGHADLVELADGTWWAVLLGIRPRAGRYHLLGRETFLAPVTWTRDGWPIIGNRGRIELETTAPALPSRPAAAPPKRDDFDRSELSLEWNFLRNPYGRDWSLRERPGHLRLRGSAITLDDVDSPALVVRSQQHFRVRCRAALEFAPRRANEEAGLTVRSNEDFRYDIAIRLGPSGREAVLRRRVRGQSRVVQRCSVGPGPLELEVRASEDRYLFFAGERGHLQPLGSLPTRAICAEKVGASGHLYFTGTRIGLYATGNGRRSAVPADFDWFDYVPAAE
jgi:xylan 1,4-beta-xylosidase